MTEEIPEINIHRQLSAIVKYNRINNVYVFRLQIDNKMLTK